MFRVLLIDVLKDERKAEFNKPKNYVSWNTRLRCNRPKLTNDVRKSEIKNEKLVTEKSYTLVRLVFFNNRRTMPQNTFIKKKKRIKKLLVWIIQHQQF